MPMARGRPARGCPLGNWPSVRLTAGGGRSWLFRGKPLRFFPERALQPVTVWPCAHFRGPFRAGSLPMTLFGLPCPLAASGACGGETILSPPAASLFRLVAMAG